MSFSTSDSIVTIESLNAAGDGVARRGDRTLAVPFTLPGERVRVRGTRLLEVLTASPHRVPPRCAHFGPEAAPGVGPCGGCSWQHIAYPEQLRLKSALVERLVRAAVRRAPAVRPMIPSTPLDAPWGYRHKAHFVFGHAPGSGRRRGHLVMGHYVRGTTRVLPVHECPVHDPRGNALAFAFGDTFGRAGVGAAAADAGTLKSLAVRVGCHTTELAATLVVTRDNDRVLRTATRRALDIAVEPPTSLHVNVHPREDGYVFGRETRRISGPARLREQVGGISFVISPTAFFQTNVRAAEILVRLVLDAVPGEARVLDLYAGAGLFALPLAARGQTVIAVEENAAAVEDGIASVRLNKLPPGRCRFVARRVERALDTIRSADAVVLDPPREGCAGEVIDRVFGDLQPAVAAYVSCNPEALARDLAQITARGYTIRSIQPVDMFPHTAHVEALAVLTR